MGRAASRLRGLRRFYEQDPRRFALAQLSFLVGIILLYLWVLPAWYWAIYRGELAVPQGLADFLHWIWLNQKIFRGMLVVLLILFFGLSYYVRRDPMKALGIRADNLWASGRECFVVVFAMAAAAVAVVLTYPQAFSFDYYLARGPRIITRDIVEGILFGFVQQFLLQSIFLICSLQIFKNKLTAAFVSAVIFSLIHAPNVRLMALTFAFGLVCCLLFLRHRNVITLGITHGIVKEIVRVLFVSVLAAKIGYYEYNLRVGPYAGKPEYLGYLEYKGSGPLEIPQSGELLVPIALSNISTQTWDSDAKTYPVFLSYHLLNAEKTTRTFSEVLTPLGEAIGPGHSGIVDLKVKSPATPGDYIVHVDLVMREPGGAIFYFRSGGLKPLFIPMSSR